MSALVVVMSFVAALLTLQLARPEGAKAYPTGQGYWMVAEDGGMFSFGSAQYLGSLPQLGVKPAAPIVGMAPYPFYEGYWLVSADGGIYSFGSAGFHGSTGAIQLNEPILDMAAHPSGNGYWTVAADGGVFAFGKAKFFGSQGGTSLVAPMVTIASTPSGNGYWTVAADGGVFAYGDAKFFGSTGGTVLNEPILGMAVTPTGNGYWLVATDGGVFAFGDARFYGSMGGQPLNQPVIDIAATNTGNGYRLAALDGGVFTFPQGGSGDATYFGSTGGIELAEPVVGIATRPAHAVAVDPFPDDTTSSANWTSPASNGGDVRLALANTGPVTPTDLPAGALVLGVEGLTASQLQNIGFQWDAGDCAGVRLVIYADTNGNGDGDTRYDFGGCTTANHTTCDSTRATVSTAPAPGSCFTWDPTQQIPLNQPGPMIDAHVITAMDVVYDNVGSVQIDDILVAGVSVADSQVYRSTLS